MVAARFDFTSDVQKHFSSVLTAEGYDVANALATAKQDHIDHQKAAGTAFPLNEPHWVVMQWINARIRRVGQASRSVSWSKQLKARTDLSKDQLQALADIESDSKAGRDLNPRLSKSIMTLDYDDLMLNDWGLHHMHLGAMPANGQGFAQRTGPLLFVVVRPSALFFLDVLAHGAWTDISLLEIVLANWPQLIAPYRLNGVLGVQQQFTDEQRLGLRKAGVSVVTQLSDGGVYAPPGGGYATSGTGIRAVMLADRLLNAVYRLEEAIAAQAEGICATLAKATGKSALTAPAFELCFDDASQTMQVVEKETMAACTQPLPFP